ncbi:DUF4145 domain-containing protein [Streptacidiphilus cavernicola]|uniref:DUF4145 domain-containing protein n=1 Tax=Streptacidiphilus cavernicola TaxID=3342716 RepID=A0ABV6W297_9ACTN
MVDLRQLDDHLVGKYPKVSGECPHCKHRTSLSVTRCDQRKVPSFSTGDGQRLVILDVLLNCDYCGGDGIYLRVAEIVEVVEVNVKATVRRYRTQRTVQLWPRSAARVVADEAPEEVRQAFAEAAKAESAEAYGLAGVGYRAVVERIVKDRDCAGRTLFDKIESLRLKGLSGELIDSFHEARMVGNDSTHDGLLYSAEEIADIAELVTEAILVLYVQPAQRAELKSQREARRTAAKGEKDSK